MTDRCCDWFERVVKSAVFRPGGIFCVGYERVDFVDCYACGVAHWYVGHWVYVVYCDFVVVV